MLILILHFTDEETKAQRGTETCPKAHSLLTSGFELILATSRVSEFSHLSVLVLAGCGGSNREGETANKHKKASENPDT